MQPSPLSTIKHRGLIPMLPKLKEDTGLALKWFFKKIALLLGLKQERNTYVFPHCEIQLWHTPQNDFFPTNSPQIGPLVYLMELLGGQDAIASRTPEVTILGKPLLMGADNWTCLAPF